MPDLLGRSLQLTTPVATGYSHITGLTGPTGLSVVISVDFTAR